jgi:hypothetical protein
LAGGHETSRIRAVQRVEIAPDVFGDPAVNAVKDPADAVPGSPEGASQRRSKTAREHSTRQEDDDFA